ncbi:MAG: hypothetical protein CL572_06620 [Alphaproteobacteria bacterium]|nr:hypothetical protein [Alphaproteobacteria bacterium]|tara:strand:+ start:218 stop:1309 length:1092 start_codon:yes stop_codon:yes gene_type:complete
MIVILGSGIIGLYIAKKLLENKKKVLIFDTSDVKANATSASVGMLAPLIETKPYENQLLKLMIDSKRLWDKNFENNLVADTIGLKKNSSLLIAQDIDEFEEIKFKKEFIKKLGHETQILNKDETLELEPNLNSNIEGSLIFNKHNQVEPDLLKKFLTKKILDMGGLIKKQKYLKKFNFINNKVEIGNSKFIAEKLIICCGAWSSKLLEQSENISFPMRPVKGISMIFETEKNMFFNNLWFKNIYIAPRKDNNLAVGATEDEKGFEEEVTLDEIFFLSKHLWESLPELEKLKFKEVRAGLRSTVVDGNPIIGPLKKNKNIICSFGHYRHGILLAPLTAEIVLDYVLEKKIPNKYCFFSPKRFNL